MSDKFEKITTELNKKFGDNTVIKLTGGVLPKIPVIPTTSIKIDRAIGVGGIPIGRITEVWGEEGCGKSSFALHVTAEAQKMGIPCLYVDGEQAFDQGYAKSLGVDVDSLYFSQPDYLEQALGITESFLREGAFIVFDSTNSLPSRAESEQDFGESHMGLAARIYSQALRKLNPILKEKQGTLLFISQTRSKIGVTWGSSKVVGVGNSLKFYASLRLEFARIATNKEQGEAVSNEVKVKVKKNKVAPPFAECTITLVYGEGIDSIGEIIDVAVEQKLMQKSGAWFKLLDAETGEIIQSEQGKPNMRQYLKDNPDVYNTLRTNTLNKLGLT